MFGCTPVVSMKHTSSDEEVEEKLHTEHREHEHLAENVPPPYAERRVHGAGNDSGFEVQDEPREITEPEVSCRNNDSEVEKLCKDLGTPGPINQPPKVVEKITSLPKEEGLRVPTHRPTPPPFPIINTDRSDSLTSDASVQEDGQETKVETKSWASLFTISTPSAERIPVDKPMARIPPFSTNQEQDANTLNLTPETSHESKLLGEYLKNYQLNHIAPSFLPRGLANRSNWCFVNSILQALLSCPPFYNLIKDLHNLIRVRPGKSITPMIDCMVKLTSEFEPLEAMNKNHKRDKARRREDLPVGNALEPSYVYQVLLEAGETSFKVLEGRQEDAEEFLGHLLNTLDEEMRNLIKLTEQDQGSEGNTQVRTMNTNLSYLIHPISIFFYVCRSAIKKNETDI